MFSEVYYKVCRNYNGKLNSVISADIVEYKLNEWVYPKSIGTFLFLFTSIEAAKRAIKYYNWSNTTIFKCEAEGICQKPRFIYGEKDILPDGTIFAYGVRLIEEIESSQTFQANDVVEVTWNDGEKSNFIIAQVNGGEYQFLKVNNLGVRLTSRYFSLSQLNSQYIKDNIKNMSNICKVGVMKEIVYG